MMGGFDDNAVAASLNEDFAHRINHRQHLENLALRNNLSFTICHLPQSCVILLEGNPSVSFELTVVGIDEDSVLLSIIDESQSNLIYTYKLALPAYRQEEKKITIEKLGIEIYLLDIHWELVENHLSPFAEIAILGAEGEI